MNEYKFPAELSNTAVKNINLHNCLGVSHKNQFGLALCKAWGFRKEKYFQTWGKWNYKNVLINTWTKTYMYSNPIQLTVITYLNWWDMLEFARPKLTSSIDSVDFHYDSDSKALKPIYFRNHLINSSVAMVLSSRSMVQPCGRWD